MDINLFEPDAIESDFREKNGFQTSQLLFFYAGIIGHAQGLDIILDAAKKIKNSKAHFVMLGEGPEKPRLLKRKEDERIENITFLNAITKDEMPAFVKAMDVAVIPLKKLDLFKGAIPSKIFENLAMKKPILLGVEGEAKALFIDTGKAGLFFEPENETQIYRLPTAH